MTEEGYFELDLPNSRGFALVQSYIPAQSLEAQLKAGRSFSEEEVKELAKAILEILKYLHGRQPPVIHRDIKPSNILLTNRSGNSVGEVYLVDFGSVQTIARTSSTMTVVGSYGYMPPEQFNGRATYASDLYSLGATLIYLVTGQHPGDLPQTDLQIEFEQAANISFGFSGWLRRMTEPIMSKRLASTEDAMRILEDNQSQLRGTAINSIPKKPHGSKILLNKNANFIDIIIPGAGLLSIQTLTFIILYFFILFIMSIPLLSGDWSSLLRGILFISPVAFILICICVFGRKRLYINRQQIYLIYKIFQLEGHNPLPSSRQEILRLDINKSEYNRYRLTIWAGIKKYVISSNELDIFTVTLLELDWLAHELSDWLGLPITKK